MDKWKGERPLFIYFYLFNCLFYLYLFIFISFQNPKSCNKTKSLVCHPSGSCGFACEVHHLTYCFMVAYQLGRTLILDHVNWRYSDNWYDLFLPVSNTCLKSSVSSATWKGIFSFSFLSIVIFFVSQLRVSFVNFCHVIYIQYAIAFSLYLTHSHICHNPL